MKIKTPVYLVQAIGSVDLFDSQGTFIAKFEDWQFAEQVVELINESQALIEELETKNFELNDELADLNGKVEILEEQISELQSR